MLRGGFLCPGRQLGGHGWGRNIDCNILRNRFGLVVENHRQKNDNEQNERDSTNKASPGPLSQLKFFAADCLRHIRPDQNLARNPGVSLDFKAWLTV